MNKSTKWKANYVARVLNSRSRIRLSGVTDKTGKTYIELFFLLMGVAIGLFIALVIARPDLIDWNTFGRAFTNGVIYSMILRR